MRENISRYLSKHGFEAFRPKAVLFDMDGVLYNSMPNHAVAWQEAMRRFGIHMTANDAYATEGQKGTDTIMQLIQQQQGRVITAEEAQEIYDVKTQLYHQLPTAEIFSGVKEVMRKLHQHGLEILVVTGSGQRPLINRLLCDFAEYLTADHIVTAYDVRQGKPAPDPYLMGMQRAGIKHPWEAIVVENAPLGIKAGAAARIFTIAVNSGPLPDEELINAGADILFNNMPALEKELDSMFDMA